MVGYPFELLSASLSIGSSKKQLMDQTNYLIDQPMRGFPVYRFIISGYREAILVELSSIAFATWTIDLMSFVIDSDEVTFSDPISGYASTLIVY